jgi:predicted DNA-binding protein
MDDLVSRAGHIKTFYITEAVLEYLDDLEEEYLALNRLEHPAKRWTWTNWSKALTWSVECDDRAAKELRKFVVLVLHVGHRRDVYRQQVVDEPRSGF